MNFVVSKGVSPKGVIQVCVFRVDPSNKPAESHTGYTRRGGACVVEASRASVRHEVLVTGGSAGGEARTGLKPGSCNGGTCVVGVQSGRALSTAVVQPGSSVGWSVLSFYTHHV